MNLCAAVHARWAGAASVRRPSEATHAFLTPSTLSRTLHAGVRLDDVHVVVAGDRASLALHDRAVGAGARVSHYYGAAELSYVAWGPHEHGLRLFPEVEVEARSGVLWVRSPYLCAGYVGPPGPMRRDHDGFATVGDRGEVAHGRVVVAGRGTAAVTTAGATVHVADVERVLRPAVDGQVVVLGLEHSGLGQVLAAVLSRAGSFDAARTRARSSLAPSHRPRVWFCVEELPLTTAGKVDRVALTRQVTAVDPGVRRLT